MSLRISLSGVRTTASHRRVRYQLGDRAVTPEDLVLQRWKARSKEPAATTSKVTFDGCRLPPGTWRLLKEVESAGGDLDQPCGHDGLQVRIASVRQRSPELRCPQVDKLLAMLDWLRTRGVLRKLVQRQRSNDSPGIPDLFLFRRAQDGRVLGGRFVEVKRCTRKPAWREPVSATQRNELRFLKELGLNASVVYVIENGTPKVDAGRGRRRSGQTPNARAIEGEVDE
jgi:hypothetical protein